MLTFQHRCIDFDEIFATKIVLFRGKILFLQNIL